MTSGAVLLSIDLMHKPKFIFAFSLEDIKFIACINDKPVKIENNFVRNLNSN